VTARSKHLLQNQITLALQIVLTLLTFLHSTTSSCRAPRTTPTTIGIYLGWESLCSMEVIQTRSMWLTRFSLIGAATELFAS